MLDVTRSRRRPTGRRWSPRRRSRSRRSRSRRCGCSRGTGGRPCRRAAGTRPPRGPGVTSRWHLLERGAQLRAVELLDNAYGFGLQRRTNRSGTAAEAGTITIRWPFRQRAVCPAPMVVVPPPPLQCRRRRSSPCPRRRATPCGPARSTSTPNSVPRSVTTAVGVRTTKGEGGRGKGDFSAPGWCASSTAAPTSASFRLPPSAFPLCFHPCGQFAQREEAAVGGIDLIGARPLENDFRPRLVSDFQQSGGEIQPAAPAAPPCRRARAGTAVLPTTPDRPCR